MRKRSSKEQRSKEAAEEIAPEQPPTKNPAAVALGKLGGLKGGKARALKLEPEKRQEIARLAAVARWSKAQTSRGKEHE